VGDGTWLWSTGNPVARILRIAIGAALFAAVIIVLNSTGAFADSGTNAAPSTTVPGVEQSLLSVNSGAGPVVKLLQPIAHAAGHAISHAPVVKEVLKDGGLSSVAVPVSTAPGTVLAPVRAAVEPVLTPVVSQVVAPVQQVLVPVAAIVAPVVAPVSTALAPVIAPVAAAVEPAGQAILPGLVAASQNGSGASLPAVSAVPSGAKAPFEAARAAAVSSVRSHVARAETAGFAGVDSAASPLSQQAFGVVVDGSGPAGVEAGAVSSPETTGAAACAPSPFNVASGPCLPDAALASAAGASAAAGASGGAAGSAAKECSGLSIRAAAAGSANVDVDWALPASMPSNPGSSPD
jgi:hypothetical protein